MQQVQQEQQIAGSSQQVWKAASLDAAAHLPFRDAVLAIGARAHSAGTLSACHRNADGRVTEIGAAAGVNGAHLELQLLHGRPVGISTGEEPAEPTGRLRRRQLQATAARAGQPSLAVGETVILLALPQRLY